MSKVKAIIEVCRPRGGQRTEIPVFLFVATGAQPKSLQPREEAIAEPPVT